MIFVRVFIQKNQFHMEISIVTLVHKQFDTVFSWCSKLLLSNEKPDELLNARKKYKNMDQWHKTNTKERTRKLKRQNDRMNTNKTKSKKIEQTK